MSPRLGWFTVIYGALKSDGYQGNFHSTDGETEKGSVGNSPGKRKCASCEVERI